jgi:hypothetical protein
VKPEQAWKVMMDADLPEIREGRVDGEAIVIGTCLIHRGSSGHGMSEG